MSPNTKQILWIASCFLLISTATRIGLTFFSEEHFMLGQWGRIIGTGLIFDFAVLPWFLLPWALYIAISPFFGKHHLVVKFDNAWRLIWAALYLSIFVVISVAEFTFWAEFAGRFDFIAVDYLVYTHEVIGNIRESYPVIPWLLAVISGCLIITWFTWPRTVNNLRSSWAFRWGNVLAISLFALLGLVSVSPDIAKSTPNLYVQQLSGNGIYAFGHAYKNNQLSYSKYYPSLSPTKMNTKIRQLVIQKNSQFQSETGIERQVVSHKPLKKMNVVMISVESLSASFLGKFGNTENLTPELDKLADQGLLFTKLYATGTRTVRGLEALSVGTPPTPGQSIVRRPNNQNLENLGEELDENGWKALWLYGGYGLFDNMNTYFGSNGYDVIDRTDFENENLTIHAENVWGIADEDLFSLALVNLNRQYENGQRFYAQIMTTSNHRPYTFPENRIDLPQGKRESAVKYTDWAIGDFIRRSKSKPWFDNTLFIIVADHTSKAAGRTDLPPSRYHIPMVWYAPKHIMPDRMERLMSQIDIGPTLMGWLGLSYTSGFFGYDIFSLEEGRERAFISTYQKLGYLKNNRLVILDVNKEPLVTDGLLSDQLSESQPNEDLQLIDEAIAWYQSASLYFNSGELKDAAD